MAAARLGDPDNGIACRQRTWACALCRTSQVSPGERFGSPPARPHALILGRQTTPASSGRVALEPGRDLQQPGILAPRPNELHAQRQPGQPLQQGRVDRGHAEQQPGSCGNRGCWCSPARPAPPPSRPASGSHRSVRTRARCLPQGHGRGHGSMPFHRRDLLAALDHAAQRELRYPVPQAALPQSPVIEGPSPPP